MKIIPIPLSFGLTDTIYETKMGFKTADINSAVLQFTSDSDPVGCVATLSMKNETDNSNRYSIVLEQMDVTANPFSYTLGNEIGSSGVWIGEITLKKDLVTVCSQEFRFAIGESLQTSIMEVLIQAKSVDEMMVVIQEDVTEHLGKSDTSVAQITAYVNGVVAKLLATDNTRTLQERDRVLAELARETDYQSWVEAVQTLIDTSVIDARVQSIIDEYQSTYAQSLLSVSQQLEQVNANYQAAAANLTIDSEVILARNGKASLDTRLDESDAKLTDVVNRVFVTGKNKINKTKVAYDTFIIDTTGATTTLAGYITTEYIPVKAGDVISIYPVRAYAIYNATKGFVSGLNTGNNNGTVTALAIAQDGFIRLSTATSNLNIWQMELGALVTNYEAYSTYFPEIAFTALQKKLIKDGDIKVVKSGENFDLYSAFDVSKEIKITTTRNGSANGAFRLLATYIDSVAIHSTADDITPIRTLSTVGANHGYTCILKVTLVGHGKATIDLGSTWTDGTTVYTLLQIVGNDLYFGCPYTVTDGVVAAAYVAPLATLTHVLGATNTGSISIATKASSQLFPSINKISVKYEIDKTAITDDGVYYGNILKVIESYNVMDYQAIIDFAKANIGVSYNNDTIAGAVKVSNTFTYRKGLKCTVANAIKVLRKTTFYNCGIVQSDALLVTGKPFKRYLDGVIAKSGFDFKLGVDFNTYNTSLLFSKYTDLVTAGVPPVSTVDWMYDTDGLTKLYGFAMGYLPDKTSSKNATRVANVSDLWDMRNTKKSYPALFGYQTLNPGEMRNCIAFRNYLAPSEAGEATTVSVIKDDKDTYIYIMAHKIINGLEISLPDDIGKTATLLQGVGVTIVNDTIDSSGLTVNVTVTYGQAVIKVN